MSRTDPRPHSLRHLTSPIGRIELLGDGTAVTSLAICLAADESIRTGKPVTLGGNQT